MSSECGVDGCRCLCHVPDKGTLINRLASAGSRIVALRARIPELEKLSRRTPPRTLLDERKKVEEAKVMLAACELQLATLESEHATLGAALVKMEPWRAL